MNSTFPGGIIDIKFSGGQAFLLIEHKMTSKGVEEQLKKITYSGQQRKVTETVENVKFVPFVLSFYKFIFENSGIPNEEEFINEYSSRYLTEHNKTNYSFRQGAKEILIDKESFYGRILRTYPSLIRDFHFFLLCYESNIFEEVKYSIQQDYFKGIDVLVKRNGIEYAVNLMIKSSRNKQYKRKKYKRHDYSEMQEIILEIDSNKSTKKVSNFVLCDKLAVDELVMLIGKKENKSS